MIRSALILSAFVAVAACAPDPLGRDTFVTKEVQTVLYSGPGEPFEVRFKAGNGAADYWCAASRYANYAGLPSSTRLFRLTPVPRPQGEGVVFSANPSPGTVQPTGLVTIGGGNSLSVTGARQQCEVLRLQPIDF